MFHPASALRLMAAWVIGLTGSVAAIRGWGPVVMFPPVQNRGISVIAAVTLVWLLLARLSADRLPGAALVAQAGAYATCLPLTAANVGRAPAVFAVTSVFAAYASLVEWNPLGRSRRRQPAVLVLPLVPLITAQIVWVAADALVAALIVVSATFVLCELFRRGNPVVVRAEREIRAGWQRAARTTGHALSAVTRRARTSLAELDAGARARRVADALDATMSKLGLAISDGMSGIAAALRNVPRPGRRVWLPLGASFAVGVAFAPVVWRLTNNFPATFVLGINDYDLHVTAARRFSIVPLNLEVPHFLFHAGAAGFSSFLGDSAGPVAALCLALALTCLTTILILLRPLRSGQVLTTEAATGLGALFFFLETPTIVLMWLHLIGPTTVFMTIHALYSPTWVVSVPFTFLALALTDRLLARPDEPRVGRVDLRYLLGATVVIAALAKPGLVLVLVPGLPLYLLAFERPLSRAAIVVGSWAVAPATAVILWQTFFLSTSDTELGSDGFTFDPIAGPKYGWAATGWPFWLPVLWIVLAAWVSHGTFLRERLVRIVLCCFAFAAPLFLLFRETGPRAEHSNLGVPAQMCITALVLLALRTIAVETRTTWRARHDRGTRVPTWLPVVALATMALIAGGLLSYLDALGVAKIPIDWTAFP